jgi:bifunctional UDP-N-acetylglucosamine pyrophosphorylase/glucosamine-1-phosphate N-acetyltransferase
MHICILAAGQSKRMQSKYSKMLHPVCGLPMISHVYNAVSGLQPQSISIIVGHQRDQIMDVFAEKAVDFVVQEELLGTAHAVSEYLKQKPDLRGSLLVMNGDMPLITTRLLRAILKMQESTRSALLLVTTMIGNPAGYGRVVRGDGGTLKKIVEDADATAAEREVREINAGIYVFDIEALRGWIPKIEADNTQKEYYLPDVVALALRENQMVIAYRADENEVMGINNRVELARASKLMRNRINEHWMLNGITMIDPDTTYIESEVRLGADTVLHPNVHLEGTTMIGQDVTIYPNCRIINTWIDNGCVIYENTSIDSSQLDANVKIGPFARVRPDTVLGTGVRIGNFVELKKTVVGEGSKANHLSYLGDAIIGKKVNVGAGTITCNYDGEKKYQTVIEDEVFVGSDTQLIAPVKVGKGAYIAAGSSITEDVPPDSLAIARSRQTNKEGWVESKKKKVPGKDDH